MNLHRCKRISDDLIIQLPVINQNLQLLPNTANLLQDSPLSSPDQIDTRLLVLHLRPACTIDQVDRDPSLPLLNPGLFNLDS
jgi:hypothetical protein